MSYRANAGAAPRPMNPPILSSRPAQPASHHSPTPSSSAGKTSPVLVRQPQLSSFESQPTTEPRPAPQPPALSASQGPAHAQAQGQRPPPLSLEESKQVARTHHSALKRWLAQEGALNSGSTRTNAREKLTRLTRQQFQELSTDVYDELVRRLQDPGEGQQGQRTSCLLCPDLCSLADRRQPRSNRRIPRCPSRLPPETEPSPAKTRDTTDHAVPRPWKRRLL